MIAVDMFAGTGTGDKWQSEARNAGDGESMVVVGKSESGG
jgi:hypothetical protein